MSIDTSMADVMTRIQGIQAQIAQWAPSTAASSVGASATAATTTAASVDSSSFAAALDAANSTDTSSAAAAPTGSDVVADATKYLGVPYSWGGTNPSTGLDCSGLVQRVYRDLGVSLPRVSGDQARAGTAVANLADAKPGDLLAFGHPVHHIAIYVGNGMMIEAAHPGTKVSVDKVYETPSAIRRILPDSSAGAASNSAALSLDSLGSASSSGSALSAQLAAATTMTQRLALLQPAFAAAEAKYHLPAGVLAAVAQVESGVRPTATSAAGAQGLMQLMPATARAFGVDPMDPTQAIDGAARLLHDGLKAFHLLPLALAAYNAGAGAVRKYSGIPPYAETQSYVDKVTALMPGAGS